VSVGIPTYNRPAGLRRTLDCITSQTYGNLEILVSDNCSAGTDTADVVREFQARDPRVHSFRQPTNLGIDGNFKFLLDKATGPLFFWAADDDEWTPDFVQVCVDRLGNAGSVMTGMRVAVRPRGLLRPKPPLSLSAGARCFDNAVAFFTNLQPSLFYGIHRTETLRVCLREFMYDYYDCFFILRQILTHGFVTDPKVCFHVGVETEAETYKPSRPEAGVVYRYWPFFSDSIRTVLGSGKLSWVEKCRLLYLLGYFTLNEFAYFERTVRQGQVRLARALMGVLRPLRHVFRVPLPNPPPTMLMPEDPSEVGFMQLPAADLSHEAGIRRHLGEWLGHLAAKLAALEGLEVAVEHQRRAAWQRKPWRWLRWLEPREAAPKLELPPDEGSSPQQLRRRLGLALLLMERGEARIQALLRERDRLQKGAAFRDRLRRTPDATRANGPRRAAA
jgi:glycosyltransferase involved in cell wall biosynthesis